VGIRVQKMVAVGHLVHKYDEIICSIHQGGHPASHHDPPVGGPWWGSFCWLFYLKGFNVSVCSIRIRRVK
jgi:hypothetical protein